MNFRGSWGIPEPPPKIASPPPLPGLVGLHDLFFKSHVRGVGLGGSPGQLWPNIYVRTYVPEAILDQAARRAGKAVRAVRGAKPRSMSPADQDMNSSTSYVMSLLETMSAIMVVVLSLGLAAVLWRAFLYFLPPQTAHLSTRTTTTTTTETQTTGPMITYPNTVFVTNTGGAYHSTSACGGWSGSRSTRSVTFCQTCAERARSLAAMFAP